ncbi:hypothetical protein [Agromyces binzhouensis]|uniref:hypothetical protein n=1 Tax=Agromyces binzhouensis TaxID=1817495 RepID=UPI0013E9B036|nr:hypothetical protein [Agromyces binzhouensis]
MGVLGTEPLSALLVVRKEPLDSLIGDPTVQPVVWVLNTAPDAPTLPHQQVHDSATVLAIDPDSLMGLKRHLA